MSSTKDQQEIPEEREIIVTVTPSVSQDDNLVGQNDVGVCRSKRKYDVESVKDKLDKAQKRLANLASLVESDEAHEPTIVTNTAAATGTNTVSDTFNHRTTLELVDILSKRVAECEDTIRKLNARIADNNDAVGHIKNILFINTKNHPESFYDMGKIADRGSKEFYDTIMALTATSQKMWQCLLENGYGDYLCVTKDVHILTHAVTSKLLKQYPKAISRITQLLNFVDPVRFARNHESGFIRKIDQWIDRNKRDMMLTEFEDWKELRRTAIERGFR